MLDRWSPGAVVRQGTSSGQPDARGRQRVQCTTKYRRGTLRAQSTCHKSSPTTDGQLPVVLDWLFTSVIAHSLVKMAILVNRPYQVTLHNKYISPLTLLFNSSSYHSPNAYCYHNLQVLINTMHLILLIGICKYKSYLIYFISLYCITSLLYKSICLMRSVTITYICIHGLCKNISSDSQIMECKLRTGQT